MRKSFLLLTAVMLFTWQIPSFADSSVDELIQKLQDKGILTNMEANQLKSDAQATEQDSQQTTFKSMLPDWVNGLKVSGDFRLRDQLQVRDVKGGTSPGGDNLDQNRGRFRARLNFEDQINDKVKVIIGVATDGEKSGFAGNDRSNNITFGGNATGEGTFNKSSVVLNKAYAIYTPNENITLLGGQMDNPIWEPVSPGLLWDPDITPIGGAVQLQKKLNDYVTPFSTNALFVLKDNTPSLSSTSTKTDPYIFITQEGIKGNLTDKIYYKAAGSYYNVSNPNRIQLDNSNTTNSTEATNTGTGGIYRYNYYLVGGAVDLGINDPFGDSLPSPIYIPQIGVFGEFFRNIDISSAQQPNAWYMGGYMGNSSLNGWGTWKIMSYYKVLERNSWLDALPDDDFYSGDTDVAGWRSEIDIGLAKNVWFVMSYFRTHVFKALTTTNTVGAPSGFGTDATEDLFQMDLNMKF